MVRIVLELAELYNLVGNSALAISHFERLRTFDPPSVRGMGRLALLYFNNRVSSFVHETLLLCVQQGDSDLEKLGTRCLAIDDHSAETFLALGYLCLRQKKEKDASVFAQRAQRLAKSSKMHSQVYALKACIKFEWHHFSEAEKNLRKATNADRRNIDVYELGVRGLLEQASDPVVAHEPPQDNREQQARTLGDSCKRNLLQHNPRACFVYALSLSGSASQRKDYQSLLEGICRTAPFVQEAVSNLAALYKEQRNYAQAVALLSTVVEVRFLLSVCDFRCSSASDPPAPDAARRAGRRKGADGAAEGVRRRGCGAGRAPPIGLPAELAGLGLAGQPVGLGPLLVHPGRRRGRTGWQLLDTGRRRLHLLLRLPAAQPAQPTPANPDRAATRAQQ